MLDEVALSNAVCFNVRNNLLYHVILMVTGEDELFFLNNLGGRALRYFFLFLDVGNKTVNQIEQAITLQHFFPQIRGGVSVGIYRVALAARITCTVRSLVERHKVGRTALKRRCHIRFIKVNRKVDEETMVETEAELLGITVVLELLDSILNILSLILVLELHCNDRDTIEGKHHINGIVVLGGVSELTSYAEHIAAVELHQVLVKLRLRLEVAHLDVDAHILEAVLENVHQAIFGNRVLETSVKLLGSVVTIVLDISRPLLGLSLHNEIDEHLGVDRLFLVVFIFVYSVPIRVHIRELLIATFCAYQEGFYVLFKSLF